MSKFWTTSKGESAIAASKTYEIEGGGNLAPIPDGAHVLAMINSARWATVRDGIEQFVEIKWDVMKPVEYANRKVFQKLWVSDLDPGVKDTGKAEAKRDKALRMLSTIDLNAGGRLSKLDAEPDDDDLSAALSGKVMVIGLRVWESTNSTGGDAAGNWVYFIGDQRSELKDGVGKARKAVASLKKDMDDEIPF